MSLCTIIYVHLHGIRVSSCSISMYAKMSKCLASWFFNFVKTARRNSKKLYTDIDEFLWIASLRGQREIR